MTAQRTTPPPRLLVIDDDTRYGKWLGYHLGVFCPDSTVSVLTHTEFPASHGPAPYRMGWEGGLDKFAQLFAGSAVDA